MELTYSCERGAARFDWEDTTSSLDAWNGPFFHSLRFDWLCSRALPAKYSFFRLFSDRGDSVEFGGEQASFAARWASNRALVILPARYIEFSLAVALLSALRRRSSSDFH